MSPSIEKQKDRVQSITPDWQVPASIKVFSTTRLGGVSEAPYDALNLGLHVNDQEILVRKNRELLLDAINCPEEPMWLDQVHGVNVHFVDRLQTYDEPLTADGTFTREPEKVLSVLTADCLPVVIANDAGSAVAVIHAGWRGLVSGVLQSGLAHFSEHDELHAWLGPAIGPAAFEVGAEVRDAFVARNQENASAFRPVVASGSGGVNDAGDASQSDGAGSGKFMADLYALARIELNRHRRVLVTGGDFCTHTDSDLFHSYRRDGVRSGRMATLAWIEQSITD